MTTVSYCYSIEANVPKSAGTHTQTQSNTITLVKMGFYHICYKYGCWNLLVPCFHLCPEPCRNIQKHKTLAMSYLWRHKHVDTALGTLRFSPIPNIQKTQPSNSSSRKWRIVNKTSSVWRCVNTPWVWWIENLLQLWMKNECLEWLSGHAVWTINIPHCILPIWLPTYESLLGDFALCMHFELPLDVI